MKNLLKFIPMKTNVNHLDALLDIHSEIEYLLSEKLDIHPNHVIVLSIAPVIDSSKTDDGAEVTLNDVLYTIDNQDELKEATWVHTEHPDGMCTDEVTLSEA